TVTAAADAVTSSASLTVSPATTVTHFRVVARRGAADDSSRPVLVQALNASNQVVTGYTGTVSLASPSDPTATAKATADGTAPPLPLSYTFTADAAGAPTFFVSFDTTGKQPLTVTDTATNVMTSAMVRAFSGHAWHGWWF